MNALAKTGTVEAPDIFESADGSVLDDIRRPGCAVAIWQRRREAALAAWLDGLPVEALPSLRRRLAAEETAGAVDAACAAAGLPPSAERELLAAGSGALALRFAGIMGVARVAVRLDVITDDACRRFHLDHVSARLLCAWRGAGTQFAPQGPETACADPACAHPSPPGLVGMQPGAVAIFRGRSWPGPEVSTVLHRSPPLAGTGWARLLLVVDPA